jgi:hypothetical protein
MPNPTKVVSLPTAPPTITAEDIEKVEALLELAKEGLVDNLIVVADSKKEKCYYSIGSWGDVWNMIGALEYAKGRILSGLYSEPFED